ncbi:MAG: amidohydrolase [Castellaniella sp.]|uniref:amidohydrolase family protein n=1 Tax=Castellaniella sp. TaxID=1955812 RepID=UPI001206BCE4|nr:amidohydrolase family protein [Castellaniella sp.]TAN27745.1 MAG: amidohydrolase [Castellaniella sp.]
MHVYDRRFPWAPTATTFPPEATADAYREVQRDLGLSRVVVVQPSSYGFDNRCTLNALAAFGASARGIAVARPEVSDGELDQWHHQGIRGLRYLMVGNPLMTWDSLPMMSERIRPLGWNINLQLDGRRLPEYEPMLARLTGNLVIDHNGKFLEPVALSHPGFQSLLRLLDSGRCWVKLSAPYETSKIGAPAYDDVSILARALVAAHPDRCLWASNWPHPGMLTEPSTPAMLDLLLDWAPDEDTRRKILVDNPAELYGF